jgi:hypothetical protein
MDVTPQRGRLERLALACRFGASGRRWQGGSDVVDERDIEWLIAARLA